VIGNRVHDLPGTGGYAGILADCCSYNLVGIQIIGNVVDNIAMGTGSNLIHGIYAAGPSSVIMNNIVTRVSAACITHYHGSTRSIVSNNVVAGCKYGIQIAADGAITSDDYTTVDNNIAVNNGRGIYEYPTAGPHNVYNNNIVYNNSTANFDLCCGGTQSGSITLTAAQFSALFVNYTGDMTGDYHLRSGAVAIDAGTTSCASGIVSCVPLLDLEGIARPVGTSYDIGAYEWH
jgi:Periplasmic copper-binding protein (NosD)